MQPSSSNEAVFGDIVLIAFQACLTGATARNICYIRTELLVRIESLSIGYQGRVKVV